MTSTAPAGATRAGEGAGARADQGRPDGVRGLLRSRLVVMAVITTVALVLAVLGNTLFAHGHGPTEPAPGGTLRGGP
jgi:hypothetical protein